LLDIEGDEHFLELSMALPFGLLMHELMMNSIKHSFKEKENAKLKIRSTVCFDKINIEYCDCSGVFPDTVSFKDTSTTGLMLIHTFIEQLNGSIDLIETKPPAYSIMIPLL
jgi:two-component sensor histidine kinase